jgi:histidine triad (HIT) family protein
MPHVPACVFCDIVAGTAPAYQVYADADCIAFLDHQPLRPGHVLLVPRTHWPTLGDLPGAQVGPLFQVVQRLALAVERGLQADGSFVALNIKVSQSVPHVHVHVVPRHKGDGLFGRNYQWIRRPYPSAEVMAETQRAIAAAVQALPTASSA